MMIVWIGMYFQRQPLDDGKSVALQSRALGGIVRQQAHFLNAEIFENLRKYRLEPKRMQLVYPYVDREANMVLFECVKGGKPGLCTEKPIIVYEKPGVYRREIYDIYGY